MKFIHALPRLFLFALCALAARAQTDDLAARELVARAMLANNDREKREVIAEMVGRGEPILAELLEAWKLDELFIYAGADGERVAVRVVGGRDAFESAQPYLIVGDTPLLDAAGQVVVPSNDNLERVRHNNRLRRAMKEVLDLIDLGSPDPAVRIQAIQTIGLSGDEEKVPVLERLLAGEPDSGVQREVRLALALLRLRSADAAVKLEAVRNLEELHSLSSYDALEGVLSQAQAEGDKALATAAQQALRAVDQHRSVVDFVGTIFRGLSLGSILLVVALGLAITFGLMGVINMAHGEMIAVGAYTTYVVQNIFGAGMVIPAFGLSIGVPGMNLEGWAYQLYFVAALPLSFLAAALVGIGLERSVIQFLYRRPLESLLATWGVSLVLQQTFRLMFGANNVQVSSPDYLSGNWTIADIVFGWNRVFVIGFAVLIVFGVWLALNRTSLGLLIRAVMQNRAMASHMGVRTTRVNMLTFGLGSGLAGLAGAFLSQIGNVGPSLGQSYIVDSFMVVVVGGVGNIVGTVISAFGIGGIDQVLQQYLPTWAPGLGWVPLVGSFLQNLAQDSSVFGKILVLVLIILFLQWRPAGIFATRGRQLED